MNLSQIKIVIRGAGEMASGIAFRLFKSNFRRICMTEISNPLAVRREVSFCEAVHEGAKKVEGVTGRLVESFEEIHGTWEAGQIPVMVDPDAGVIGFLGPVVVVDAVMAKRNLGTKITDASLVIGIGPGFSAGKDVHLIVESNRGHNLGRVIQNGEAEKDTGIPGVIAGHGADRVFRSPGEGRLRALKAIGEDVKAGETVALVDDLPVKALIGGVMRGLIRDGTIVHEGMKLGDIDPRGVKGHCYTVSDKTMAIGGGVMEAILSRFNS